MSVLQRVLRPVAFVAGAHARSEARRFVEAQRHVRQTQDELLRRLIDSSRGSQFHADHSLGTVRTYEEFVRAVPLRDCESLRPYMDQVYNGHPEALFAPGTAISMFAITSGTTGEPKHIPVTQEFMRAYRRGWNVWGVTALDAHRKTWLRKLVTLTSSCRESLSPTGIPCGAISGMLAETQKWVVKKMYPVPAATREIHDPVAKLYTALRASITHDVGMLTTANPSSLTRLAEVGQDHAERLIRDVHDGSYLPPGEVSSELRKHFHFVPHPRVARRLDGLLKQHGRLLPRHYWDLSLIGNWTGGTLGLYLPRVREFYGDVPTRDIGLLASEGRMSVPISDSTPAGVAETISNFLEFIPSEQIESPRPAVLRVHELQEGQEYFIVLTNWAGLWRYSIDDRVRCVGFFEQTPLIEFLSKGLHTSSITGEKVTEHQVVQAMHLVAKELPSLETFELQGCFGNPPFYRLRVEAIEGVDFADLARRLDEALKTINVEYESKRSTGRLGRIEPEVLHRGAFLALEAQRISERRGRGEQYKHKYLLTDLVQ